MKRLITEKRLSTRVRRVLVVDDDPDMVLSLTTLLRLMGHEAAGVTRADLAVDAAQSLRADIIFLDLGMPKVDGYALAHLFRATPNLAHATLVAVSAHGDPQDRARARRAGFDAHVLKPADPALVESILAQFHAD